MLRYFVSLLVCMIAAPNLPARDVTPLSSELVSEVRLHLPGKLETSFRGSIKERIDQLRMMPAARVSFFDDYRIAEVLRSLIKEKAEKCRHKRDGNVDALLQVLWKSGREDQYLVVNGRIVDVISGNCFKPSRSLISALQI
jgi:hypothetical protein